MERTVVYGKTPFINDGAAVTVAAHAQRPAVAAVGLVAAEHGVAHSRRPGVEKSAAEGHPGIAVGAGRGAPLRDIASKNAIADREKSGAAVEDSAALTGAAWETERFVVGKDIFGEGQIAGGILDAATLRGQAVGNGQAGDGYVRSAASQIEDAAGAVAADSQLV